MPSALEQLVKQVSDFTYNDPLLEELGLPPGEPQDDTTWPRELTDRAGLHGLSL